MLAAKWKNDAANPFKATQKWNAAVNIFRVEMPVKNHRHFLRNYEDTFTGAEAAIWFLNKLQNSNHFEYPNKYQVIALLDKFLKSNVFEPVLGDKTEFKPNNTLYQFPSRLPLRSVPLPNLLVAPPAPRPVSPAPLPRSPMKRKSMSAEALDDPKLFLVDLKAQAAKRQKNALDTERVWETILFGRLEALFDGKDIQELIPPTYVNGSWIAENANFMPPASIKEYFDKNRRDFPTWVQSAMKNLSNWPSISGFGEKHTYAGFEKDVLLEIVNYFKASEQPFIPFEMADVFRYAYIFLETQENDLKGSLDSILDATSLSWTDRLKSIQPQAAGADPRNYTSEPEDEGDPWRRMPLPRPASTNPFIDCTHESINRSQLMNYRLPPDTCFETAFTTESPTTRVVHTGTLKFCKARSKRRRSKSSDSVLVDETWHSTASHVSGLERDMSSLSVDKSSSSSSSKPSHSRSHSGGYVNLALSNSIDDEEPPLDELNMSTALATIKVLAKKAKQSKADESCNLSVVSAKTTTSRAISLANGLINAQNMKVAKRIYQLLLLLLPPDNRKKMCFLLQYLSNLIANKDLKFSSEMSNKEFVVQSFCEFVLGLPEADSVDRAAGLNQFSKSLSCRVVSFLLEERDTVLFAPSDLKEEVEQHLARFEEKEKTLPRPLRPSNLRNSVRSVANTRGTPSKPRPLSYCRQVSTQQFEQQKCSGSQKALQELLELMINDKKMKPKDKEKRLLSFKDSYPHIYMKRIPTKQDEEKIFGLRKKAASFTKLNFLRL